MYQSHRFSSALLLCLATIMVTLLVPPAAAGITQVHVFNNKDEALKKCDSIQGYKFDDIVVYPGPQGDKDILYLCGDEKEQKSKYKVGTKCKFQGTELPSPNYNVLYYCYNGHWQFSRCFTNEQGRLCNLVTDYK